MIGRNIRRQGPRADTEAQRVKTMAAGGVATDAFEEEFRSRLAAGLESSRGCGLSRKVSRS